MIPIAFVENRTSGVVKTWLADWEKLSERLARCDIGEKDGRGWMPADIEPGQRTAERVKSVSLLVLDVEAKAENVEGTKKVIGPEPPVPDSMSAELGLWGWRCVLHTSYNHTAEHPRYRLIFDLSRPLVPGEVKPLGLHVAALLGIGDCIDTGCLEPARLFYLPRCPADRRELFRHAHVQGVALPVDELLAEAARINEVKKSAPIRVGKSSASVIDAYNAAHDVGVILEQHGYQPHGGRRWLWPGSTTGLPGVRLLPDAVPERVYSSHGGDPLNDGHAHDAFDLWRILRHGSDLSAAVKDAAQICGMATHTASPASLSTSARGEPQPNSGNQADEPRNVPESTGAEPIPGKPRLLIENSSPDRTVAELRDILADRGEFYDRGVPVRLAFDQAQGGMVAQVMSPDALVLMTHTVCRPYVIKKELDGSFVEVDARFPRTFATMYLEWRGEWQLRPLNGIASSPLLREDGVISSARGYDSATGMWQENVPDVIALVPERPTRDDAVSALQLIRDTFQTFCFADAEKLAEDSSGLACVDTSKPPGKDESGFLIALLTAVCRPSLYLAPGVLLRAAPMSGAGAGKGLLARCICIIAFGREPHAVTAGANSEELEKRIAAELIQGSPALFLDNLNNTAFRSNLLASAITERPARVRILGKSQMLPLNASAFVILTGNGLTISEDLARRFVAVDFDAGTEDPEKRQFSTDIRANVTHRRPELLAALLTIWRWGRLDPIIKPGQALGSFEQWCKWVRDPLRELGCTDPAERVSEAKQRDVRRQEISVLFGIWWGRHRDSPVTANDLHDDARRVLDPQERGRQFRASQLEKLSGTRIAEFVLTRQASAGKWGAATYALKSTKTAETHMNETGHSANVPPLDAPCPL